MGRLRYKLRFDGDDSYGSFEIFGSQGLRRVELDLRGVPCSRDLKRLPLYFEGDEREALGSSSCFNREEVTIRGRRLLISFRSFPRGEIIIERVIGQQTSLIPTPSRRDGWNCSLKFLD